MKIGAENALKNSYQTTKNENNLVFEWVVGVEVKVIRLWVYSGIVPHFMPTIFFCTTVSLETAALPRNEAIIPVENV